MLNGYIGLAADTKVGMQAMDVSEEVKSEDHGAIRAVLKRHHASACRARTAVKTSAIVVCGVSVAVEEGKVERAAWGWVSGDLEMEKELEMKE
jgi:hypothetical protein